MTTITALPPAPSRANPATFADLADTFVAALPAFGTEANAVAGEVNTNANTATTKAAESLASANAAAISASNALTSENNAETAATEAAALTESYQGALASDPTLDKHSNALTAGDWYINTNSGFIRAYNGSTWVNGVAALTGVSSLNGLTGDLTGFTTNTGTSTLSNKTLTTPVIDAGYTEQVFSVTGSTPALAATNGGIQTWTLAANSTPTDSISNGQSIILGITASTYTVTWPAGTTWSKVGGSGTAPTLTSTGINWLVLWKVAGVLRASFLGTA